MLARRLQATLITSSGRYHHTRAVLSLLALDSSLPLGLKATALTSTLCSIGATCSPVVTSQPRAVLPALAVARSLPKVCAVCLKRAGRERLRPRVKVERKISQVMIGLAAHHRSITTFLSV